MQSDRMSFTKSEALPGERLRREAEVLRRVAHPNIVKVLSLSVEGDHLELRLARCHGQPLLDALPADRSDLRETFAAISAAVSHVHDCGYTHGDIRPEHVMITPAGRPVLCGFGNASVADEDHRSASDVIAIGSTLDAALGLQADEADTAEDRLRTIARRARSGAFSARELCEALRSDTPLRKPRSSGRHFAASPALRRPAVGSPRNIAKKRLTSHRSGAAHRPKGLRGPAVTTALLLLALGGFVAWTGFPFGKTSQTSTLPPCTDGDPACPLPMEPVVFNHGGQRYAVGERGDQLLVNSWNCRPSSPVLLQHTSGAVFVFDSLGPTGIASEGRRISKETGLTDIYAVQRPSGCNELVGKRADGTTVTLDTVA